MRRTARFAATTLAFSSPMLPLCASAEELLLEEVIVTARKREESLQEVPVAVSAFSAESMESLGIKNMRDFDGLVPGLNLGGGGNGLKGDGNAFIRAVGQRETRVTIDSGVGIYLDEVYIGRASGALLDAVDIESVQVLRGPQGTLFGKNTTGGAILYRSTQPSEDFGGEAKVTLGNYDRTDLSLAVDAPLIKDTLLSRVTLAGVKQDGYAKNDLDGTDWIDDDRKIAMGQLRWLPTENLVVDFNANYTKTDQRPQGMKCKFLGEELAAAGLPNKGTLEGLMDSFSSVTVREYCDASGVDLPLDKFQSEQNSKDDVFYQASYAVDAAMASTTVEWEFNDQLMLKSISAYRNTEQTADEDIDGMAAVVVGRYAPENNDTDQYSQEFQFIGDALEERLNYTLGLYAFHEQTNDDWQQDFAGYVEETTASNPAAGRYSSLLARSNLTERETQNTAYASFAQMDYDLTEQVIGTLGVRYTWEERRTNYREARVYLPSIGNGSYIDTDDDPNNNTIYTAQILHSFTEPGGASVKDWLYGFDPDGDGGEPFVVGAFGHLKDDRNDDDWSPMASLKFLADDAVLETLHLDEAMTYVTYSSGFRSGGVVEGNGDFDGDQIFDLENFKPEYVDMYEIGFKVDAFDRRLRSNVALYYQEYDDIQLTTTRPDPNFGVPLPAIENAGKAEISGVEVEFTLLPTDELRIIGSAAYMDAEYKEWLSEVPDPVTGEQVTISRADEPMPRAPEWTGFLAIDYYINTNRYGTFIPNVLARYSDETYGGFDRPSFIVADEVSQPAETFYDARLTWQAPDEQFTVTAWCRNLTDIDDHPRGGVPTVGVARTTAVNYAPPRMYGVDLIYRFGTY